MNPRRVVIPVKLVLEVLNRGTGIQGDSNYLKRLDSCLRRNDRK
jgi:hypothetical protein